MQHSVERGTNKTKRSNYSERVCVSLIVKDKVSRKCPQATTFSKRWGEGGMEVGEEGDYTPIATLSPPE